MSNASASGSVDLGTFDGESRRGRERSRHKVRGTIRGPIQDDRDGEGHVALGLTATYPAKRDETIEAEVPLYAAKRLRDRLDRMIRDAEE